MAIGFLWKPFSSGGLNPNGTSVLLNYDANNPVQSVGVYDASGKLVKTLAKAPDTVPEPGKPDVGGPPVVKYYSKTGGNAFGENLVVKATYADGTTQNYNVPHGGLAYNGEVGNSNPGFYAKDTPRGAATAGGTPIAGVPGQFAPGQVGQYGAVPAYLGGTFPSPFLANYAPIQSAPYNFTDPQSFAQQYGSFERGEIQKNANLSSNLALGELNTELKGLESFLPASTALKQSATSLDNIFNQFQRSTQVDTILPGVSGQLNAQGQRAETYAQGEVPNSITDRALELGIRSNAADMGAATGFGSGSLAGKKISDLMSAEERINLSKYGDQLLTQNIGTKASLLLAPTEYSNAGQEIRVMPSLSGSQLAAQHINEINQISGIPAVTALGSNTQQNQFTTGLQQQTNQFNAGNLLQSGEFNVGNQNSFGLQKFGYDVGYSGAVAGASQNDINTNLALQQQQQYQQFVQQIMKQTQNNQMLNSIFSGITSLLGSNIGTDSSGNPSTLFNSIINGLGNIFQGSASGDAGNYTIPSGGGGGTGGSGGGGSDSGSNYDVEGDIKTVVAATEAISSGGSDIAADIEAIKGAPKLVSDTYHAISSVWHSIF